MVDCPAESVKGLWVVKDKRGAMEQSTEYGTVQEPQQAPGVRCAGRGTVLTLVVLVVLCGGMLLLPTPVGLTLQGQRVLAVAALAIGLWCTEALPMGVTGMLVVMALVLSGGVAGFPEALIGYAQPVAYFLIGV